MHVAITGSSGFLGTALTSFLTAGGHEVTRIVRRPPTGSREIRWDPQAGELDPEALRGVDAIVHLAGEGIAERRWTDAQKRRILESRTTGTTLIARTMAALAGDGGQGPRTLVSVSAIGYYGDRGDEVLTTDAGPGSGFLPDVCVAWEAAADPARQAGIRVVHPRIGIVQSPEGGALGRSLPLFKLGLGGRFGSGRQYWSWITRDDVVGVIHHALVASDLSGAINATAPNPVTNAEYTRILGRVLGRPAVLPIPKAGPAALLGFELAGDLLFSSARVLPENVLASGYDFQHPTLEAGLRATLGR